MNPYYYLFYKLYKLGLSLKVNDSQFSAVGLVTLILALNIFVIEKVFTTMNLISNFHASLFFVLLIVLNSILFLWGKRYEQIKEQFDKESKIQMVVGWVCVSLYILFSFTLPLIVF